MAKKILIVDDGSHMKKSAVEALTRRLLMFWVVEGVSATRQKLAHYKSALPAPIHIPEFSYIPEKLPPYEIHGLKFAETDAIKMSRLNSQVARYQWSGRSKIESFCEDAIPSWQDRVVSA